MFTVKPNKTTDAKWASQALLLCPFPWSSRLEAEQSLDSQSLFDRLPVFPPAREKQNSELEVTHREYLRSPLALGRSPFKS